MKLGKVVIVVAMMGMCLALVTASVVAANGSSATTASAPVAASASQLIDEAKKLYAAHDYQAALKRLQAVNTGDLNFFEKAFTYDPLLSKTQKAVPAKAADEKALADGNDALGKQRFATAAENLSQAADSDYLTAEQTAQAKAMLLKAQDGLKASNEKATALIGQAKAALKEGKVADARKDVDQVAAMDVKLGWMDKAALSDVQGKVADAEKAAKAPAPVVAKPAEKPAVAAAPAAPAAPAKPSAKDQMAEAKKLYDAQKYDDALALLKSVNTDDLNFFDKSFTYNPLLSKVEKAVAEAQAAKLASAAKPAEKPVVVVARPVEAPAVAKPAEVAVVARPISAPPAVVAKGAAPLTAAGVPTPQAELSLMDQVKRAEAEDEMKLGAEAMGRSEFMKAKIHYEKALSLWPDNVKAQQGLKEAEQYTGERAEPLTDVLRQQSTLARQLTIAQVQELLAESAMKKGKAERAEDYTDALLPLDQADRLINVAKDLTLEEQERLREEVLTLRHQITALQGKAREANLEAARRQAQEQENNRRIADERERGDKLKQLWERATELRKSDQTAEALQVVEKIMAVEPTDERARRWHDDLLFLQAQEFQVQIRTDRKNGVVDALADNEASAVPISERLHGEEEKYLRYPNAKKWKELTELRRELLKAVQAEPKGVSETRKRLGEEIDLDFERTSLDNVLKYIGELQKVNIVISPDIAAEGIDLSSRLVDLKVRRISIEAVFGLILGADLGYRVEGGYVLITTRAKLQQNLPVVTYPVQDLIAAIPDYGATAPQFNLANIGNNVNVAGAAGAGGGGGGGGLGGLFTVPAGPAPATNNPTLGITELTTIIKQTVNATSDPMVAQWSDEGGPAVIQNLNGMLIVSQTARGHERIAELLEQLRRERAIMVSVEVRFLTVSDQFLNEITLDVDAAFFNRTQSSLAAGYGNGTTSGLAGGPASPVTLPDGTVPYPTLPGAAAAPQVNQPITVQQTGSNGQGLEQLIPLAGTAFEGWVNQGGMLVSGVFLDDIQVGFLLRAIQADQRTQTLTSPRITMFNGQHTYITDATMTSYVAGVAPVVGEAAAGFTPVIGTIPVGTMLDITATVSADRRYVQMNLHPTMTGAPTFTIVPVEAVGAGGEIAVTDIEVPTFAVTDFATTVSVPDGGTLLMANTKHFNEVEAETGAPGLDKIPFLKRLFNNRGTIRTNANTLILVRPKIIIQSEEEHLLGYDSF